MVTPHSRRRRPPAPRTPIVPIAAGGGALVLIVVVVVLMKGRGRSRAAPPTSPPAAATNVATAPATASPTAAVSPSPSSAATPPSPAPAPAPVAPAPKPAPLPTPRAVQKKLEAATTAAQAADAARDAEKLADAALIVQCWTRVFELDPTDAAARQKLDVRPLEPKRELPGFSAIDGTTQRVHLRPFYDAARGELTKTQRDAVVARWDQARAAIDARVAKARTEPYYEEVDQLRLQMRTMKFFDALEYEMVESRPPYALFVEVEGKPEARQLRREEAEKSYTPFLDAYDKKIRSYLFPLAPKPPQQEPLFPVFVLLRSERYRDYCIADDGAPPSAGRRAHYEPGTKRCITYSPVIKVGLGAFEEGVQSLLHELTHAWVDRLASSDGGESRSIINLQSHWFSEGIAEYMSCQFMHFGEVRFQPWRSQRIAGTYRPPGWRIPARDALSIPLHGLDAWAALQVKDLAPDKRAAAIGTISSGFYADMSNFILWLNLRSGANRAAQFEAYARAELSGNGGFRAFQRWVPGLLDEVKDLDGTIDDFVKRIANGKINPYKEFEEAQAAAGSAPKK